MRRRELLRGGAALLGAAIVGPLAACERPRRVLGDPSAPLGPMEAELRVYNWSDYIAPDTIAGFEREHGVRVTYETYESNEEMLARLLSGGSGCDVVVPSGYSLPMLRRELLAAPIRPAYVENLANLAPAFAPDAPHEPVFGVPYQWGITGIAWRRDRMGLPPRSWSVFHDETLAGRMTMMDDAREVLGAMLKLNGHSLNSTDPVLLRQAKAEALRAKPNLRGFVSAPVKQQLIAGEVWVAQLWNGDAAQARTESPEIEFTVPREGSLLWTDYLVIPSDAPHPRAAHAFINYILRPEVGAAISNQTGYGSPNAAARPLITTPLEWPGAAERERLERPDDLGPATALWNRIWAEVKSG